ncbi:ArsR/SmtB family transcription factor [Streptomyces sp. NPDC001415]
MAIRTRNVLAIVSGSPSPVEADPEKALDHLTRGVPQLRAIACFRRRQARGARLWCHAPERSGPTSCGTGALQAPDAARLAEASGVFTTLADPTRLHLLWLLARQEADVTSLSERCGASRRCGCVVLTGG